MSQDELKVRTTEVMRNNGANFHFQAMFYEATSHEVVGSRNPKFSTLQPKLRLHGRDTAWSHAFEFALEFLRTNGMELTRSAVTVECGRAGLPRPEGQFNRVDREAFFKQLIAIDRTSLQEQVDEFTRGE
jgi:hypothetical protein